jgi:hypothetical protein
MGPGETKVWDDNRRFVGVGAAPPATPAPMNQEPGMPTKVAFGCGLGSTRVAEVCVARPAIRPVRRRRGGTKESALRGVTAAIGSRVRPTATSPLLLLPVKNPEG